MVTEIVTNVKQLVTKKLTTHSEPLMSDILPKADIRQVERRGS